MQNGITNKCILSNLIDGKYLVHVLLLMPTVNLLLHFILLDTRMKCDNLLRMNLAFYYWTENLGNYL